MERELFQGERIDDMGFGGLLLIQKPEDFCYGIDAVLLADFAKVRKDGSVADLGTGTGAIPLILAQKTKAAEIVGVEVQEGSYNRAQRSVELNHLNGRLRIIHADIKGLSGILPAGHFDTVVSNPPYNEQGGALTNENEAKSIARHETTATLEDFMATAAELLKDRGDFYLIHRPSRLVDIFSFGRYYHLEPKEIRLVHPSPGKTPNIVLVHCIKNGGPELRLLEPLCVYNREGGYTDAVKNIYKL